MTFVLKNLNELKVELLTIETRVLKSFAKSKIEELDSPMKEALLFLKNTRELDDCRSDVQSQKILYGAIFVLKKYLLPLRSVNPLSLKNYLYDCLDHLTGQVPPNLEEQTKFFSALNQFLKVMFQNKNSMEGLNRDSSLPFHQIENLEPFSKIIKTSYELECETMKKIHQEIAINKSCAKFKSTSVDKPYSPFAFDKLKNSVNQLLIDEPGVKGRVSIGSLDSTRAIHMSILDISLKTLDQPTPTQSVLNRPQKKQFKQPEVSKKQQAIEKNKNLILAGMMLLIREDIAKGYSNYSKPFLLTIPTSRMTGNPSFAASRLTTALQPLNEEKGGGLSNSSSASLALQKELPLQTNISALQTKSLESAPESQHYIAASSPSLDQDQEFKGENPDTTAVTPQSPSAPHLAITKEITKIEPLLLMPLEDVLALITSAYYFLHTNFFTEVEKNSTFNTQHIFKDLKLNVFEILDFAQELISHARISILNRCIEERKNELQEELNKEVKQEPNGGYSVSGLLARFGALITTAPPPKNLVEATATQSITSPSPLSMTLTPASLES